MAVWIELFQISESSRPQFMRPRVLHMNEPSYRLFKKLEGKHLESYKATISFASIESAKLEYSSENFAYVMRFYDFMAHYHEHNDRYWPDSLEGAFWLVFLCEKKVRLGEGDVKKISEFLTLFGTELYNFWRLRTVTDSAIAPAMEVITFPPVEPEPSPTQGSQSCLCT